MFKLIFLLDLTQKYPFLLPHNDEIPNEVLQVMQMKHATHPEHNEHQLWDLILSQAHRMLTKRNEEKAASYLLHLPRTPHLQTPQLPQILVMLP
jgi:hypothetical protein